MNLLLDTHVLLWLVDRNVRLGRRAHAALLSGRVQVSSISVWEIAIKRSTGRLHTPEPAELLATERFPELAFTSEHGRTAGALPLHHRDPFDRALIAQAQVEGLVLVTADPLIQQYDVALLDASR